MPAPSPQFFRSAELGLSYDFNVGGRRNMCKALFCPKVLGCVNRVNMNKHCHHCRRTCNVGVPWASRAHCNPVG